MESKVSSLKWLAGDLKKTRLQAKMANQEKLEKYKNTPYEIEKEVLEGIIDTLTTKENKQMKSAMGNLKKFNKKRLIKSTSEVSSDINSIDTESDKNHPIKFTKYSQEWETKVDKATRKEEFKGKTKDHIITKQAIDVDMEDAKNKKKEAKVISKMNKRKQKDRINEPNSLPKEKKESLLEKKKEKTRKRKERLKKRKRKLDYNILIMKKIIKIIHIANQQKKLKKWKLQYR